MPLNRPTIKETHPNIDCKFCELHNYVESDGKTQTIYKYAVCNNLKKTHGCCYIDIAFKANPLDFKTSCQNCKEYVSKSQLSFFLNYVC